MKILVYCANLANFDKVRAPEGQPEDVDVEFVWANDESFPPRFNAMTPRLQARIVKMFGWQMWPGYDIYLWIDASCRLARTDSVAWFLKQLGEAEMAVFKHPHRVTIKQEADYLKHRLAINCPYITPRYENELIDEQLKEISPEAELYASTAFIYRNSTNVQEALKEWWYHTSRYHSIDQLSLPFAIRDLEFNVIPDNYLTCKYLEYVRKR